MPKSLSRRQFLSAAAALGASFAVSNRTFAAASPMDAVRIGVVGCGQRGLAIIKMLRQRPGVCVAAVADSDPAAVKVASGGETRSFMDWRRLVERADIGAVVIATPDHLHAEMAEAALAHGKDIYCEAPFCRTWQEAERLRARWERAGRIIQMGAAEVSRPQWTEARRIVRSGGLGGLVRCQVAQSANAVQHASAVPEWRRHAAYGGGPALASQFDSLAGLLHATGLSYPLRVSVLGGMTSEDGQETPDSLLTTIRYPEGVTVVLLSSVHTAGNAPTVLRGTRDSLYFTADGVALDTGGACAAREVPAAFPQRRNAVSPLDLHLRNWLDAIRSRGECVASLELACKVQAVIDAAFVAFQRQTAIMCDTARGLLA